MGKKVLLIDDTKNIRMMISTCLESLGYRVDYAENGYEGIKIFKNDKYDLVILDIRMPKLSGTELLKIIKGIDKKVPVLIITAFPTIKNAVECIKMGAVDYLRKPFTTKRIKEVVENIMKRDTLVENNDYDSLIESAKKSINNLYFDNALKYLKKAISINVEDGEPFNLIGIIYETKNDFYKAYKYYNIALQLEPNSQMIKENIDRVEQRL